MTFEEFQHLVRSILSLPRETEWIEFKCNNSDPEQTGQYISALSNSAALHQREAGYLLWGVEDGPGNRIVGTTFKPHETKGAGNENLEPWLTRLLSPRINFQIDEIEIEGKRIVMFCIQPATNQPVRFKGIDYIRVGSYKYPLKDHPEKERALWSMFSAVPFERGIAASGTSSESVLDQIDYPAFFRLLKVALPENRAGIIDRLIQEKVIARRGSDRFDITNMGAILYARRLATFDRLSRKALRIIIYSGKSRLETIRERQGDSGYAVGFEGAIRYVNEQLPQNEQIGQALRAEVRMYPEIAIRELVANALIHQDFNLTGTGPTIEIFVDRMEISNPGRPLIDTLRFLDEPPQSRNEALAALMRRMNICEERGSGIDKVVSSVEIYQLPAPEFTTTQEHTKVTLFAYRKFAEMERADRTRACYQHACLCYVSSRRMTNATLRQRFGIEEQNYPMVSRVIAATIEEKLIKLHDPHSKSGKHASYVPFWA